MPKHKKHSSGSRTLPSSHQTEICLAQVSLNNVHKRGLKHHHFTVHTTQQCLDHPHPTPHLPVAATASILTASIILTTVARGRTFLTGTSGASSSEISTGVMPGATRANWTRMSIKVSKVSSESTQRHGGPTPRPTTFKATFPKKTAGNLQPATGRTDLICI